MTSVTTKPDSLQPQTETAVHLFDNWIDPIERRWRARATGGKRAATMALQALSATGMEAGGAR